MKPITTTPVIFRGFGREKAETVYHLPDVTMALAVYVTH